MRKGERYFERAQDALERPDDPRDGSSKVERSDGPDLEVSDTLASVQAEEQDRPDPNLIFTGKGKPPVGLFGSLRCELPSPEEQIAGFYHPKAGEIIKAFPGKFKRYQKLGDI